MFYLCCNEFEHRVKHPIRQPFIKDPLWCDCKRRQWEKFSHAQGSESPSSCSQLRCEIHMGLEGGRGGWRKQSLCALIGRLGAIATRGGSQNQIMFMNTCDAMASESNEGAVATQN